MRGMNNQTGKALDGLEHLRQRLTDVFTTPKASRIMNREYGCDLSELVDQNMTPAWMVQCYVAIANSVSNPMNGLQDFRLERIQPSAVEDAKGVFDVTGVYLPTGNRVTVTGVAA